MIALTKYSAYAKVFWPIHDIWHLSPALGVILVLFLLLVLARMRLDEASFFTSSIPLGIIMLPQTLIWGLTMLAIPLTLSWRGKARYAVIFTWIIGWIMIFGSFLPNWWKIQTIVIPALTLAVVSLASRAEIGDG